MDEVEPVVSEDPERLTWAEIRRRYPDQYVCLVETEKVAYGSPEITTARVIGHGPTDEDAFDADRVAKYDVHEVRFTGVCTMTYVRPALVIDDEILEFLLS
ncbi:MAG: hypothetical protein KF773_10015 [Deltaproteobacteria bacterium]|nr:hypothetical protein [Deltaproteobacteria bacterium]